MSALKIVQKEAMKKLYEKMSAQAFLETFDAKITENLEENKQAIADTFGKAMAKNSDQMFDIIDKLIDAKLETSVVTMKLSAPNGPVTGLINLKGI